MNIEVIFMKQNQKVAFRGMLQNYLIETIIYGGVVFLYYKFVLQLLTKPLFDLFNQNLNLYAVITIVLILLQALILEIFISLIVNGLGLRWPRK